MIIPLGLDTTAQEIPAMQGPGQDAVAGAGMAAVGLVCLLLLLLLCLLVFVLVFMGKKKRRRQSVVGTAPAPGAAYPVVANPPVGTYPPPAQAVPYPPAPQTAPYPVTTQAAPFPPPPQPAPAAPVYEVNWREDTILRPVIPPETGAEVVVTAGAGAGQH